MTIKKWMLGCLILALVISCKKTVELGAYQQIYMPQSSTLPKSVTVSLKDMETRIVFGAALGGVEKSDEDIKIQFEILPDLVNKYNEANHTDFMLLPSACYNLSAETATILTGTINSPVVELLVNAYGNLRVDREYLLPVSIAHVSSDIPVNEDMRTAYFHFKVEPAFIARDDWEISDVSTEEPAEDWDDRRNNGFGRHAIDGNPKTYWHTQWNGGQPSPPHHLTVDMHGTHTINGLSFLNRIARGPDGGNPENITIEFSTDASTWTEREHYKLSNTDPAQQLVLTTPVSARYFKVTIETTFANSGGGANPSTHIAEINAF